MIKEVNNLQAQTFKNSPIQTPISNISVHKNSIAYTEVNGKRHVEFTSKKRNQSLS